MRLCYVVLAALLAAALIAASCSNVDDPGPACGGLMEYNSADTVVICFTEDAVDLINEHYSVTAYLLREYQIAHDPEQTLTGNSYNLAFNLWKDEPWLVRRSYLPFPFQRNVLIGDSAQLLFNILTYPEQFSFGWSDTYADSIDLNDPTLGHIWFSDNRDTPGYDGRSDLYTEFGSSVVYLR